MPTLVTPTDSSSVDPERVGSAMTIPDLELGALADRQTHSTVLLTWPVAVEPTGVSTDGEAPVTDGDFRRTAFRQWQTLRRTYERIDGVDCRTMNPLAIWDDLRTPASPDEPAPEDPLSPPEALPDGVFCANVAVPYPDERRVVLGDMAAASRRDEPTYAAAWFEANGYEVERLGSGREESTDGPHNFEGTGDAIWHPGRQLLWGGVGERTDRAVYREIAERMDVPVITLDPTGRIGEDVFFHLDICFAPLDEETVLLVREVFDEEELAVIESVFDRVIDCPYEEGKPTGAYGANVHCPDGEHVIVPAGAETTIERVESAGFTVYPVDTSAFIDGCAGSVFCMKLALP